MAGFDDVAELALGLPETAERLMHGWRSWRVREKLFVWERPLGRGDRAALGDAVPDGPILGARIEHLLAREVLIQDDPEVFFTIPHFEGYPAVLVRLERIGPDLLEEVVTEAWLARAPKRLVKAWEESRS